MKKKITLLKVFMTLCLLLVGIANAWGETKTISLNNIGASLGSTSNESVATVDITATGTSSVYTLNYLQGKKQGSSILLAKSTGSFISNKTPMPGNIKSVTVYINSGASSSTTYHCAFSTTECTTAYTTGSTAVKITGGNSNKYTCSVSNATYFCVSLGNANNGQVLKLEIEYETADDPTEPYLSVSPKTIDFGEVYQQATATPQQVTVTFGNLTTNDVEVELDGDDAFNIDKTYDFNSGDKITITPTPTYDIRNYEETLRIFSETDNLEQIVTIKMKVIEAPAPTGTFAKFTGDLVEGDYVICDNSDAMKNEVTSKRLAYASVSISENKIVNPDKAVIWHISVDPSNSDCWLMYNKAAEKYAAFTTTDGNATLLDAVTDYARWQYSTVSGNKEFSNKGKTGKYLRKNGTYGFASYTTGTGRALTLYQKEVPPPTSISVKTAPTKVTYKVGETFDPTGLVITANYDGGAPEEIAYAGKESKFAFSPDLTTALTKEDNKVTITYGGKSVDQTITVNLNILAIPTNLQATNVASTSATLTWDAVENASSYEVKLNDVTKAAESNSLLVEGLTASTAYTWTVKAKGDNTTYADSEASEESSFTTPATPTVAYTVTFNGNNHGTPASESITEESAGAGVTLPEVTPDAGYQFVGWATTSDATGADAGVAGATYYPTANITLYAVYNEVYTINYMVNGVSTSPQENVLAGTPLEFPEVTAPDADHVFRGWVTEAIEGTTDTEPAYVNTTGLTATADATYYAVFAEKSEGEVTWNIANDIAANDVIIIATNKNYTDHDMKTAGTISSNLMSCKASTFNSEKTQITSVADGTLEFTLGGNSTSGWTLQNGTNYLGMSGDKKVALSSTSSTWTISISDGVATVSQKYGNENKNYSLQYNYNNGSDRFTGYTSSLVAISLYKKTQSITYSNYCTTVVTKVLTSISLSGEYPTVFWKGETFSHEGMTVIAHYDDESTKDVTTSATFSGYNMSTAGEQTVIVTYDTQSTTYDITVKNIANTKETAYTVAEAKSLIDANPAELATTEVYVKGIVSEIKTPWNEEFNNITYNISEDGETSSSQFQLYRCVTNGAVAGDYVIAKGKMQKYGNVYQFSAGNTIVNSVNMSITSAKWGTFCAPFDVDLEDGVKAYTASETNGTISFEEVSGTIEAGTPVVVYSAETVNKYYFGELSTEETCTSGVLVGVYAAKTDIEADAGYTNYVLQNNSDVVGFYKVAGGSTISLKANRCYMTLPTSSAAKDSFTFEDSITGINEILNPTNKSVEGIFDLNGRKLAAPQKGINIINGVKVIVK